MEACKKPGVNAIHTAMNMLVIMINMTLEVFNLLHAAPLPLPLSAEKHVVCYSEQQCRWQASVH